MESKITANNLSKSYEGRIILRDVSLEFSQGEVVGLFGPNGAGKTTCFTIMIGMIKPDFGQILLDTDDITTIPIHLRAQMGLGYLPQEPSIFRTLSVKDNIAAVLEIAGEKGVELNAKANSLMEEFSISHLQDKISVNLSGGERRRLEIARALAANPKFMLLDEPLAGIDPLAVDDIKDLIMHLKERGIGILITDHNVRDTLDIVDRAYIMYDGKVLMHGSPEEVINSNEVRQVYLGQTFDKSK